MVRASVRTHFRKRIAVSLVFLFALGTSGPRMVHAATLTVSNTNDNGAGSLRQAIFDASPGDTITFSSALTGQTITLTSGELVLDKNLTVTGRGASQLAISGNHASRVFHALNYVTTTIQGLTIRDAYRRWNFYDNFGGGIKADSFGALTVNNSAFIGNECEGGRGGAIMADCDAFPCSELTVNNSTFSSNSASFPYGGWEGQGGALAAFYGEMWINDSTFSGNSASAGGGGIIADAYRTASVAHIKNSLIADSTLGGNCAGDSVIATGVNFSGTRRFHGAQ